MGSERCHCVHFCTATDREGEQERVRERKDTSRYSSTGIEKSIEMREEDGGEEEEWEEMEEEE